MNRQTKKEVYALRAELRLYWLISDDREHVEGPYAKAPTVRDGWTVFGVAADTLGREEWK